MPYLADIQANPNLIPDSDNSSPTQLQTLWTLLRSQLLNAHLSINSFLKPMFSNSELALPACSPSPFGYSSPAPDLVTECS